MIKNVNQFIIDETGKILDTTTTVIRLRNNYTNTVQVVTPFGLETSISATFKIQGHEESNQMEILRPYRDNDGTQLKGKDVISNDHPLYLTAYDWRVWEFDITPSMLSTIIQKSTRQTFIRFHFRDIQFTETATRDKGTFGSSFSTTRGDLPDNGKQGDFYRLDTRKFQSIHIEEEMIFGDIAVWDSGKWEKGSVIIPITTTAFKSLPVERYEEDIDPYIEEQLTDMIIRKITELEISMQGNIPEHIISRYIRNRLAEEYDRLSQVGGTGTIYVEQNGHGYNMTILDLYNTLGLEDIYNKKEIEGLFQDFKDKHYNKSQVDELIYKSIQTKFVGALVFNTVRDLEDWIADLYVRPDGIRARDLSLGQSILIREEGVPNYWVAEIPVTSLNSLQEISAEKIRPREFYVSDSIPEHSQIGDFWLNTSLIEPIENKMVKTSIAPITFTIKDLNEGNDEEVDFDIIEEKPTDIETPFKVEDKPETDIPVAFEI